MQLNGPALIGLTWDPGSCRGPFDLYKMNLGVVSVDSWVESHGLQDHDWQPLIGDLANVPAPCAEDERILSENEKALRPVDKTTSAIHGTKGKEPMRDVRAVPTPSPVSRALASTQTDRAGRTAVKDTQSALDTTTSVDHNNERKEPVHAERPIGTSKTAARTLTNTKAETTARINGKEGTQSTLDTMASFDHNTKSDNTASDDKSAPTVPNQIARLNIILLLLAVFQLPLTFVFLATVGWPTPLHFFVTGIAIGFVIASALQWSRLL